MEVVASPPHIHRQDGTRSRDFESMMSSIPMGKRPRNSLEEAPNGNNLFESAANSEQIDNNIEVSPFSPRKMTRRGEGIYGGGYIGSSNISMHHSQSTNNITTACPFGGLPTESTVQFYHSQIVTLKEQLRIQTAQSEQISAELSCQKQLNSRLVEEIVKINLEKTTLLDENKILKKAVAIQDSKLKDSTQSVAQLQEMLGKASEYIFQIERINNGLLQHINNNGGVTNDTNYSDFNHPPPPPDVF